PLLADSRRPGGVEAAPGVRCYNRTVPDLTAPSSTAAPTRAADVAPARPDRATRRRIGAEIWIVLGLSLGKSAVYAIINIVARLTAGTPLRDQSASLNVSQSARPYLDLTYQLVGIFFAVLPVALALYLLSARGRSAVRAIGLDGSRLLKDVGSGVALAAAVGIHGAGFSLPERVRGTTDDV